MNEREKYSKLLELSSIGELTAATYPTFKEFKDALDTNRVFDAFLLTVQRKRGTLSLDAVWLCRLNLVITFRGYQFCLCMNTSLAVSLKKPEEI